MTRMAMAAFHEKSSIKCFLERMKIGDAALSYSVFKKYDIKKERQKENNKEITKRKRATNKNKEKGEKRNNNRK